METTAAVKKNAETSLRLKEVDRIRAKLEVDIEERKHLSKRYKKFYNLLHGGAIGSTSINATIAGVSLGFITNPATLLPLVIVGASLGAVGILTGLWSKLIAKRLTKHEKLFLIANNTLNKINQILSKAVKDGKIDDEEFEIMVNEYQQYLQACSNIKDAFANQTLIEKEQVTKNINDQFKK